MFGQIKILGALGAVSALIVGLLLWQLGNARDEANAQRERAGALRAQLDTASQAAQINARMADELSAEIIRRDQILGDYAERLEQRRTETAQLMTELQEANRAASAEYQDCLRIELPASVRALVGLRDDTAPGDRGSDRSPDRAHPPAGQPDEALPGA